MSGSGTCLDVCQELGVPCMHFDIHEGFDACDPQGFGAAEMFDLIWAHPPYWRQKLYALDDRDLSRAPTLEDFLRRYRQFIRNCARSLKPGGKLAILMGDYCDRDEGFVPLTYHTKRLAFDSGLRQCCTDIIRFSHGASSSKKVYRSSFIPGSARHLHGFRAPALAFGRRSPTMNKQIEATLLKIAQDKLRFETLETRRSDSLDFHDIAVWCVKNALEAAFQAAMDYATKHRKGV